MYAVKSGELAGSSLWISTDTGVYLHTLTLKIGLERNGNGWLNCFTDMLTLVNINTLLPKNMSSDVVSTVIKIHFNIVQCASFCR